MLSASEHLENLDNIYNPFLLFNRHAAYKKRKKNKYKRSTTGSDVHLMMNHVPSATPCITHKLESGYQKG